MADAPVSKRVIYRLARLLEREHVSYAYMGGVALSIWAIPRATFDLDVALSIREDHLGTLLATFDREGFVVDPVFVRGHRDTVGGMPTVHVQIPVGSTLMTVDIFLAGTPFLESVLSRRKPVELGDGSVFVVTAADLLLFKVIAGRRKDLVDIDNLLAVQGIPERGYLEQWASALAMKERLDIALRGRK